MIYMKKVPNGTVSNDLQWFLTLISRSRSYYRPIDALDVLCAHYARSVCDS